MQKNLVTPQELSEHLGDPGWIVFDVRHDLADVEKAGARTPRPCSRACFLHLDEDLSGARTAPTGAIRSRNPRARPQARGVRRHGTNAGRGLRRRRAASP